MAKLPSAEALDALVICPRCHTLHQKVSAPPGWHARCSACGATLYRNEPRFERRVVALAVTGAVLLLMANLFPLVRIDLLGSEQFVTIPMAIGQLLEHGFYVVGIGAAILVAVVPALVLGTHIALVWSLATYRAVLGRRLLVFLARLMPWNMVDIFAVSILVAMVKIGEAVTIHFGAAFWALVWYIALDMYLTRSGRMRMLWDWYERIAHG